ncbi:MAG TPA: ATP-binding protein [Noviherbaspirillum sp.]|nr:ATP-binding protein [Noviherbaspirillum sp.]
MIESIYPYLILSGCTIGAVLAALWYQARTISRINLALIRLNEQLNFDTPTFLRKAWPLLARAGLSGMAWQLDWFGVLIEGKEGEDKGEGMHREIQVSEMTLAVTLYKRKSRGERRYFGENLIATFLLLLHTDMLIKAGTTDATFSHMAKLNLFLQHDMKNVAQFIQLMSDQLDAVPSGKEQQVLDYLRMAAPLVRERADRIVHTLAARQTPPRQMRRLDLRQDLVQLGKLHRLHCTVSGNAEINVPANTLDSALDNILKNYSDIALARNITPHIDIAIDNGSDGVAVTIAATNLPPVTDIERLFEPFWSSHPSGLGIGLYQARQTLERCGGALGVVQNAAGALQFQLYFPHVVTRALQPNHM